MVALTVLDSKRKQRHLEITGIIKPSGARAARVVNEEKANYLVQIHPDGSTSCQKEIVVQSSEDEEVVYEECKGHHYTGKCYHITAVANADLPTFEQIEALIAFEDYDVVSAAQMVSHQAQAEAQISDAYEQVKMADLCPHCRGLDEQYRLTGKCYWLPDYSQL